MWTFNVFILENWASWCINSQVLIIWYVIIVSIGSLDILYNNSYVKNGEHVLYFVLIPSGVSWVGGMHPESKVYGANMGPTWALSVPGGPHVGPINFAIRAATWKPISNWLAWLDINFIYSDIAIDLCVSVYIQQYCLPLCYFFIVIRKSPHQFTITTGDACIENSCTPTGGLL